MVKIILEKKDKRINWEVESTKNLKTGFKSDRDFLKKRSAGYINMILNLDTKSLTSVLGWNKLMEAIQEEFGTAELDSIPLGIVGKCFLGEPFEVHILDLSGSQIIKHFKFNEPMPKDFEKARVLALHNSYAFVEVYTDKLILIKEDGSSTKL